MAYVALYRKYRSQNFEELMGQDQVTTTLQNALRSGRLAHAYLFHGARGCGKTSTARLLSRALNCVAQDGPTPTPCGVCRLCVSIREGACMDVIEIDAASETGVDNVREKIIENVQYASSEARYKVYIIDEVHDLSAKAFDALLKTLEEPPPHVIFILATTEYQKVPITIRSRCQGYQFKRGSLHDLSAAVERVINAEGFTAEPEALQAVARSAEGSWRDALSILEQVLAYSDGHVSAATVHRALGTVGTEMLARVTETLARGVWNETLDIAADLVDSGTDVRQLLTALSGHLRDLMLLAAGAKQAAALELGPDRLSLLQNQATLFTPRTLLDMMGELSTAEKELRFSNQHRVILERVLCRLMMLGQGAPVESQPVATSRAKPILSTSPATKAITQATPPADRNERQAAYAAPSVVPRPPTQQATQEFATNTNMPAAFFAANDAEAETEADEADEIDDIAENLEAGLKALAAIESAILPSVLDSVTANALEIETPLSSECSPTEFASTELSPSATLQNLVQNGTQIDSALPRNGSASHGLPSPSAPTSPSDANVGKYQFADEVTLEVVQRSWPRILKLVEKQSPSGASYLQKGQIIGMEGKMILLSFKEVFARDRIQNKGKELVEKKINEGLKTEGYRIQCILEGQQGQQGMGGSAVMSSPPGSPPNSSNGTGVVSNGATSTGMATLLDTPPSVTPPSGPARVMDFEIQSAPPPAYPNGSRASDTRDGAAGSPPRMDTRGGTNSSTPSTNEPANVPPKETNAKEAVAKESPGASQHESNKGMLKDVLDIFGGQVVNTEPL